MNDTFNYAGGDEAEAKRRAAWLTMHDAPMNWVILTIEEIAAIRAEMEYYKAKCFMLSPRAAQKEISP